MNNPPFKSIPLYLELFTSKVQNEVIRGIEQVLEKTYNNVLAISYGGELELLPEAYNSLRNQYNADTLLEYLLGRKHKDTALWVISEDLYCQRMNFIFGSALYLEGGVLSIYRLTSQELIEKEAAHEIGHVLGLTHCQNNCIMRFSNSLWEAERKPSFLCETCKKKVL
jgi:archaemetzincin